MHAYVEDVVQDLDDIFFLKSFYYINTYIYKYILHKHFIYHWLMFRLPYSTKCQITIKEWLHTFRCTIDLGHDSEREYKESIINTIQTITSTITFWYKID